MNYKSIYDLLVQKAKNREEIPQIKERHHILPKSMGGTNKEENIVFFTPEEHYVAHHLLWKIYRSKEMHYAFWLMVNKTSRDGRREYKVSSRTYQSAKEQHQIEVSLTHTGKIVSKETRKKASISLKGKVCWAKGLTGIHSPQGLENISKAQRGRKDSIETRLKKSLSKRGIKTGPSPLKGIPAKPFDDKYIVICPHCNKQGTEWNMKRYHFDMCKFKEKENLY